MSEQFWYTWDTWGFSGNNGFQVRAVSQGLLDEYRSFNMNTDYNRNLMKYVSYKLPVDKKDFSQIEPYKAPLSLAFLWTGERILMQRAHAERIGASHEASCFSHIVMKLPQVRLETSGRKIEFSAREAIRFWRADFWKTSVGQLKRGELSIPQVIFAGPEYANLPLDTPSFEKISAGPPGQQLLQQDIDSQDMLFVLQAFLRMTEEQRLYIAADPDRVAALIWGLTNALPRTLRAMINLSFSTYEHDALTHPAFATRSFEGKILPIIIGTCWLYTPDDFPDAFYEQNFALNLYNRRRSALLTHHELDAFAAFAVDCLFQRNQYSIADLYGLSNYAEDEDVVEWPDFLRLYNAYKEPLASSQIREILAQLAQEITQLTQNRPVVASTIRQVKFRNFQHWIMRRIAEDRSWWRGSCQPFIKQLQSFVNEEERSILAKRLDPTIEQRLLAIHRDLKEVFKALSGEAYKRVAEGLQAQGSEVLSWSEVFATFVPEEEEAYVWANLFDQLLHVPFSQVYRDWWSGYVRKHLDRITDFISQYANSPLARSFLLYTEQVARQFLTALPATRKRDEMSFWAEVLSDSSMPSSAPGVWELIFNNLSSDLLETPGFRLWWEQYGQQVVLEAHSLIPKHPGHTLSTALRRLSRSVAGKLSQELRLEAANQSEIKFWQSVLALLAPPESFPDVALYLWQSLLDVNMTTAYKLWWKDQGRDLLMRLRDRAQRSSAPELTEQVRSLLIKVAEVLLESARKDQKEVTLFWGLVLKEVAQPIEQWPEPWQDLLRGLSRATYNRTYQAWWKEYANLVSSISTRVPSPLFQTLTTLADMARSKLYPALELYNQKKSQGKEEYQFWAAIATAARDPRTLPDQWLTLHRELWRIFDTPGYSFWWTSYGKSILESISEQIMQDTAPHGAVSSSTKAARSLDEFRDIVSRDLQQLLLNDVRAMPSDPAILALVIEVFSLLSLQVGEARAWIKLMQQVADHLLRMNALVTPGWETRKLLLETWFRTPGLEPDQFQQVDPWLTLRWSELANLEKLPSLPMLWKKAIFQRVLAQRLDISEGEVALHLCMHLEAFSEALQQTMRGPAQRTALNYFALLAQHEQYASQTLTLLNALLVASSPEGVEELLQIVAASPLPLEKLGRFLEEDRPGLLARHQLAPGMLQIIEKYVKNFEIDSLGKSSTSALLQKLQKRKDLSHPVQVYVNGWLILSQFLNRPDFDQERLISVARQVSEMDDLKPGVRSALREKLMPALITYVTEEVDIGRVMDNLAGVLIGSQNDPDPGLTLLGSMANGVNKQLDGEKTPRRFIPYIKVILKETYARSHSQRERSPDMLEFQVRHLDILLHGMSEDILRRIDSNAQEWMLQDSWLQYREERRRRAWQPYREALAQKSTLERLVATFQGSSQLASEDHRDLSKDELLIAQLAQQVLAAAKQGDREALLTYYKQLYPYSDRWSLSSDLGKQIEEAYREEEERQAEAERRRGVLDSRKYPKASNPQAIHLSDPRSISGALVPPKQVVVKVLDVEVTQGWIEVIKKLKEPYIDYRIVYLEKQPGRRSEMAALQHQRENLEQAALDDWINDVLLEKHMKQQMKKALESELQTHVEKFRTHLVQTRPGWLQYERLGQEELETAMRIFRRRIRYIAQYFYGDEYSFMKWIEEERQKQEKKGKIVYSNIPDDRLEVRRKGWSPVDLFPRKKG